MEDSDRKKGLFSPIWYWFHYTKHTLYMYEAISQILVFKELTFRNLENFALIMVIWLVVLQPESLRLRLKSIPLIRVVKFYVFSCWSLVDFRSWVQPTREYKRQGCKCVQICCEPRLSYHCCCWESTEWSSLWDWNSLQGAKIQGEKLWQYLVSCTRVQRHILPVKKGWHLSCQTQNTKIKNSVKVLTFMFIVKLHAKSLD